MEWNYLPKQDVNSSKKGIVTKMSHKIKKTLGISYNNNNNDNKNNLIEKSDDTEIIINNKEPQIIESKVNKHMIRTKKMHNVFDSENSDEEDSCCQVNVVEFSCPRGPTGPTGPPCPFPNTYSSTFIHLDRESEQLLAKEDAIIWDANTIEMGDINNNLNTSEIYIWRPGYYFVYYNLYHQQPCQFSLFKNGIVVAGSTICSTSGASQNSSATILLINPSDFIYPTSLSPSGFASKIEVVNHTSTVPNVKLTILNGGNATPQITATISIVLLFDTKFNL